MGLSLYLDSLRSAHLLIEINETIDLEIEVAEHLQMHNGKAVLFHKTKNSKYPLVGNLLSSRAQLKTIFNEEKDFHKKFLQYSTNPSEPEMVEENSTFNKEMPVNLHNLPIPKFHETDGNKYLTSGIVFAQFPGTSISNMSIHRIMIMNNTKGVIRIVPRDLHQIYNENKTKEEDTPVAIAIGYHPLLALASSSPLSSGSSELSIANSLMRNQLKISKTPKYGISVPTNVEFILEGKILAKEELDEGPFVDITGTIDDIRKQPVIEIEKIYHKEEPIFQTILPAYDEHLILMGFPREAQIYDYVSKVIPTIHEVYLTPGGSGWLHAVISISPQKYGDAKNVGLAAFAAHPSLKWCTIVDEDIDIHNGKAVEWASITRAGAGDIIVIDNVRGSSLDPSKDPEDNSTIKVIIDATRKEMKGNKGYSRIIPF